VRSKCHRLTGRHPENKLSTANQRHGKPDYIVNHRVERYLRDGSGMCRYLCAITATFGT
jgi:hypothetical protein